MEIEKSLQTYTLGRTKWYACGVVSLQGDLIVGGCQVHLSRQTPTSLVEGLMVVRSEQEPRAFRGLSTQPCQDNGGTLPRGHNI